MLPALLLQLAIAAPPVTVAAPGSKLTPALAEVLARAGENEMIPVIVALDERVDTQALIAQTDALPKHQRAAFTRARLEGYALQAQAPLRAVIDAERAAGRVAYAEMLWTCNAHLVTATPQALARIAAVARVAYLSHDPHVPLELVQDVAPPPPYSIGTLPYATSFESGALPAEWHRELTGLGQATVTSAHGPASEGVLHLELDGAGTGTALAVLHLDLSAVSSATLSFDIHPFDSPSEPQDGLFISVDGTTYKKFASLPTPGAYQSLSFDLGLVALQQGLTLAPDTRIAFGWGGSGALPAQGYAIDRVAVVANGGPVIPPEPNIGALQAPTLWAVGVEGQGSRILIIDDGVQSVHPALAPQRWTNPGEIPGNALDDDNNGKIDDIWGWDFVSNDNNPTPIFSEHGTNTAGIVCGNGAFNGNVRTGMAPKTTWAAALVNGEGNMLSAYQYAIAAGFDCITSSHSWKWASTPNYPLFRASTDAELAAGMIHANSIGNQGTLTFTYPIPYNIATPGNCPAPWSHPQQVQAGVSSVLGCAGIFLGGDAIYADSGVGPAAWENVQFTNPNYPYPQNPLYFDYPYLGGTLPGLLKPDLSAYVNVKTTNGTTGYNPSFGGTSAATPHLGGALCLMIGANPSVPPRQIAQALQETALDLGPPGKDVRFGAGKIRVYDAAVRILSAVTAYPPKGPPGGVANLALTGHAGSPYILAAGLAKTAIPTTLGITIDVGNPLIIIGSGALNGYASAIPVVLPVPNDPLLSGLNVHFQLFTDDSNGPSKRWLASLVETFRIL